MPTRKKAVYKHVPKPVLKGNKVKCYRCGTDDIYSMFNMLNHDAWCALAKKEQEKAAAAQAAAAAKRKMLKNH